MNKYSTNTITAVDPNAYGNRGTAVFAPRGPSGSNAGQLIPEQIAHRVIVAGRRHRDLIPCALHDGLNSSHTLGWRGNVCLCKYIRQSGQRYLLPESSSS